MEGNEMEYEVVKNAKYPMWYAVDELNEICYVSLFKTDVDLYVYSRNKELNDRD